MQEGENDRSVTFAHDSLDVKTASPAGFMATRGVTTIKIPVLNKLE